MDAENAQKIAQLEEKIDKIYISVEKTRKYFFWTMVISVAMFVIPLIGVLAIIPFFLNSYLGPIQSLTAGT